MFGFKFGDGFVEWDVKMFVERVERAPSPLGVLAITAPRGHGSIFQGNGFIW